MNLFSYSTPTPSLLQVKQTLNSVNYAISTKQKRLDELNGGEIDQVQQQANAVMQRNATLQNLQVDLKHKAFEHEVVKKSMYEMGESLDVLSGKFALSSFFLFLTKSPLLESDDELRAILQQYMQSLNERKGETSALVGEKERNEADEVRFRNEHTSKVTKYGQLKAEKEAHLRTVTQMSKMVVELSKTHHYTTFSMMQPSALSEDDKQKFITKLRQDITIHYEILEKVQVKRLFVF